MLTIALLIGKGIVAPYILEDLAVSFQSLGHKIHLVPLSFGPDSKGQDLSALEPDIVISIDGKGLNSPIVEKWGALKVAWFVDNPYYFEETKRLKDAFVFVWAREYVSDLKKDGLENVYYLPLATNLERFHPGELAEIDLNKYGCDVSFVGSIHASPEAIRKERLTDHPAEINALVDLGKKIVGGFYQQTEAEVNLIKFQKLLDKIGSNARGGFEYLVDREVDSERRYQLLDALKDSGLRCYGSIPDEASGDYSGAEFQGPVQYGEEVRKIYKASKINLNATRPQLRSAVNQRILDVYACGGFLLTDYREDLGKMFSFSTDEVVYTCKKSLLAKIKHYLKHPIETKQVTENIKKEIEEKHTYLHRSNQILEPILPLLEKMT